MKAHWAWVHVHVCVYVDYSTAALRHGMPVCNDETETSYALKLLVPSDEPESSSDRFHLPCLNLNLPRCSTSNSLRTNGICQPTSKCFVFFSYSFPAVTKGFKCASTQAAKYPSITSRLCLLRETFHGESILIIKYKKNHGIFLWSLTCW